MKNTLKIRVKILWGKYENRIYEAIGYIIAIGLYYIIY
jgi:hypothetical protein